MHENERFSCSACGIDDIFPAWAPDGSPLCMDCAKGYCSEVGFPLKAMLFVTVISFTVAGAIFGLVRVWLPIGIAVLLVWLACGTLHGLIKEVLK